MGQKFFAAERAPRLCYTPVMPYTGAMPTTTATATALLSALRIIAGQCDGAVENDGVGFNGQDTKFGRRVAEFATPADLVADADLAAEVYRTLNTYTAQLKRAGVKMPLPKPSVTADATVHAARETARRLERAALKMPAAALDGMGGIAVTNSFDIKENLKTVGARWNSLSKAWIVPVANAAAFRDMISRDGLTIKTTADVDAVLSAAKAPKKNDAPAATRVITVENDTATISFPYDATVVEYVRGLPGRRWNGAAKVWTAPVTPALINFANAHGFTLPAHIVEAEASRIDRAAENVEASKALASDADVAIKDSLYPFQIAGVEYAIRARRCIIADEMGLGKTRQGLSVLETLTAFPAVIVCPASLKGNWLREVKALLPGRTVEIVSGRKARALTADITIINYDILAAWVPVIPAPMGVVLDESHYIKNPKAARTIAAQSLCQSVPADGAVILLTGTPVLNRPVEFVEQIKAIGKINLFGGEKHFRNRYCGPAFNGWGWTFNGASNLDELNTLLRADVYVRRMKEDVLTELPAKTRAPQWIDIPANDMKIYKRAEANIIEYLRETKGDRAAAKARMARALVEINTLRGLIGKAKINSTVEWVENFVEQGKSLVVFANHKNVQSSIIAALNEKGIECATILGGQSNTKTEAEKARFMAGDVNVIVCSLKAAREGHTLTKASDVLFVELGWTPGEHSQAEDRCHRIGQSDNVTAWYLLGDGTIDTTMYDLIESKRAVVDAAANGGDFDDESILAALIEALGG